MNLSPRQPLFGLSVMTEQQRDPVQKITEDDIHAEDIQRRTFLTMGVFTATGLAALTAGCGGLSTSDPGDFDGDPGDADTGDPADTDATDPADEDAGDPADMDGDPKDAD